MIRSIVGTLALVSGLLCSPASVRAQGDACPQSVKFWLDQCEQGGKKNIICLGGMQNLVRCMITEADVIQWKKNDGSFETTASLAALSNANLLTAICSQLAGPSPKDARDTAEAEYLALMLNLCVGALPLNAQTSKDGIVSEVIDSFENALNTGIDIDQWEKIADKVNQGGVDATRCPDPESVFSSTPPC